MTWEGYWWPNLVQWIVGGALTAIVGAVVGFWFRRIIRQLVVPQLGKAAENAHQGSISASQAAQDASEANLGQKAVQARLTALQGALEGMRDNVSASLGHRAKEDLRFRQLEQQLEQLRSDREGPPRAAPDRP